MGEAKEDVWENETGTQAFPGVSEEVRPAKVIVREMVNL